jgi:hypothetical protein
MAVLVTAIYLCVAASKSWVAGTSGRLRRLRGLYPAMTPKIISVVDLAPALHDE